MITELSNLRTNNLIKIGKLTAGHVRHPSLKVETGFVLNVIMQSNVHVENVHVISQVRK